MISPKNSMVRGGLFLALLFANPPCWGVQPQNRSIRFSGEVARGVTFRKHIGHGLDFVLTPSSMGGGITGWTIGVSPQDSASDSECRDFAWVVTPPFRFQNVRYLDTSYGTTAQEALAVSPRDFNFVLSCDDYKAELHRVERALWPANFPKEEVDDALAMLGKIEHGVGRLWIKDSRYIPGDKSVDPVKLGEIQWIKFDVEIEFPGKPKN